MNSLAQSRKWAKPLIAVFRPQVLSRCLSPSLRRAFLTAGCLAGVALCACAADPALPDSTVSAPLELPLPADSLRVGVIMPADAAADSLAFSPDDLPILAPELALLAPEEEAAKLAREADRRLSFNPDPTRAVWLSALFPGLGQLYNRRYWKLPLIVGGFMGLGYGTSWNNTMLRDYTRAYADLLDSDPSTRSYMDFFPPNVREDQLDKSWLTNVMRSRKNFYRRNRDLCIIGMVGVYLLAIVDAYVDASLSHFDISPELSMDIAPALIPDSRTPRPGLGLLWALNF